MLRRPFLLLPRLLFLSAVLSLLFYFSGAYQVFQAPKAAGAAGFTVLLIILSASLHFKRPARVPMNAMLVSFFAFFAWMVFRLILSPCRPAPHYLPVFVSCAMFLLPAAGGVKPRKYLLFINLLALASCVLALVQLAAGSLRPFSFFGNPLFFGEFLLLSLPLLIVSALYFEKNRLFFVLNICLCLACALLTGSRGVMLSGLISCAFVLYMLVQSGLLKPGSVLKNPAYPALFLLSFAALFLVPNFTRSLGGTLARGASDISGRSTPAAGRALMARASLQMIKDNPVLGAGAGGFRYYYQKYQSVFLKNSPSSGFINSSYAHNDYLQLAVEAGPAGLALFIIFVFFVFRGFDRASSMLDDKTFLLACGFLGSAISCLIESFFNFPLFVLPASALFFISCGFIYTLLPAKGAKNAGFGLAAAAVLLCAALFPLPGGVMSDLYLKGALSMDKKYLPYHDKYYLKAIQLFPGNFAAYSLLGASYTASSEGKEALAAYENALKIYPYSADMLYNAGALSAKMENYKAAEQYLRQSIVLYPGFAAAHLRLAQALSGQKLEQEASAELAEALRLDPSAANADFEGSVVSFGEVTGDK
jgi:O-antigen ligase